MTTPQHRFRILIIDDNESIHNDLKKILIPRSVDANLADDEAFLFGAEETHGTEFEIDSAFQGREGLDKLKCAQEQGDPYSLAFVDVRMPPGWDGIETIEQLWRVDPVLQVVICTAHSDYNWSDVSQRLGVSENLVVLKKPFDVIEAIQLAHAMTAKSVSMKQAKLRLEELDNLVEARTIEVSEANKKLTVLAAALKAAANSITITDPAGEVVWTNPAFTRLSGYTEEDILGGNRRRLKSGVHDASFYRGMWTTISAGQVWRGEIINRRKDGTLAPEEMTITPVVSTSGEITNYIAINQDITERKEAENALREAEEKYRILFENAVVGMFQAKYDGRLLNVNRAFAKVLGYDSPSSMFNEAEISLTRFIDPQKMELWSRVLQESGTIRSTEVEILCKDGGRKWVLANIRGARNEVGDIVLYEGTWEDITERKVAQQQVSYMAYYDALTGLPNRLLLQDRLKRALATANRLGGKAALLFLDLDRFKIINDSLGHSFGDLLLQQVAKRLKGEIRDQDTVSRVGGDEFLIVLNTIAGFDEAQAIATRIVKSLTGSFSIQGRTLSVSCSLGISVFPEHGHDAETLIKNADAAMYGAKEKGSNTLCFFTDEMNERVIERLTLENSLRTAIEKRELFLVYQPQIDILTGQITGLEALLRWKNPHLGLVMPDRFIRIAENSGLMAAIGEWVIRTSCIQTKKWLDEGINIVPVAVNVSAVQFRQEGFREIIKQVLHETGLQPQYLELELTESLLLSNADVMFKVLQDLKEMGVKLAIDDFGTGYSSLSYLRQFPVTKLKIDRSFVRGVASNPNDAAIASAIISMSKGLNLTVIAEGVEDAAQLAFLREHGCDEYQGYYFAQPLSVEDTKEMLQDRSRPPYRRIAVFDASLV